MSAVPPTILPLLDLTQFTSGSVDQKPYRVIDPGGYNLIAQVTVEEDHEDDLYITEHPVEYGAPISDHAYKVPARLRMRVGWSNAYVGGDVAQVYEQVLLLQASLKPFSIATGKRWYDSMMIAELRAQTNTALEFSFLADIAFRQVQLVQTSIAGGVGGGGSDSGPAMANPMQNNLGNPQANMPTLSMGQVQTPPATVPDSNGAGGNFSQGGSGFAPSGGDFWT